jgi:hypothetical protein
MTHKSEDYKISAVKKDQIIYQEARIYQLV